MEYEYLLLIEGGQDELIVGISDAGPLDPDHAAVAFAYAHLRTIGAGRVSVCRMEDLDPFAVVGDPTKAILQ